MYLSTFISKRIQSVSTTGKKKNEPASPPTNEREDINIQDDDEDEVSK